MANYPVFRDKFSALGLLPDKPRSSAFLSECMTAGARGRYVTQCRAEMFGHKKWVDNHSNAFIMLRITYLPTVFFLAVYVTHNICETVQTSFCLIRLLTMNVPCAPATLSDRPGRQRKNR